MSFAKAKLKVKQVTNYFNKLLWSDPGWRKNSREQADTVNLFSVNCLSL